VGVCRTHYARNLATKVPKGAQPWVLTLLRTIFDQPDADQVGAQFARVVEALEAKFPTAAEHLAAAEGDLLAFTAFPRAAAGGRSGPTTRRSGSTARFARLDAPRRPLIAPSRSSRGRPAPTSPATSRPGRGGQDRLVANQTFVIRTTNA